MVVFNACVRGIRADGYAPVYIRISHKSKSAYIKTHLVADKKGLRGKEIRDRYILNEAAVIIKGFYDRLNRVDTRGWDINGIVAYLTGADEVSFTDFFNRKKGEMLRDGRESSASSYQLAYNSLAKFIGKDRFNFSDVRSAAVREWVKSLSGTARAKNLYPSLIKAVWEAGLARYNDYDNDVMRIRGNPFAPVSIPPSDVPRKRAVDETTLRRLFGADLSGCARPSNAALSRDVMTLSFCLAGMNTADLYDLGKDSLKGGRLCYERKKTRGSRRDRAYIEITVPGMLLPLFDRYAGAGDRLFSFAGAYVSAKAFNQSVNRGLKALASAAGVAPVDTYTFRHSWATVAKNRCGATIEQVGFCLNHSSAHRTTSGYIEKDFSTIDVINARVIGLVFGQPPDAATAT